MKTFHRPFHRASTAFHRGVWLSPPYPLRRWKVEDALEGAPLPPPAADRPTFIIRLRAQPGVDPIRALRQALKVLLRRFGLRVISIEQERDDGH
jgi:hypothetical protein